MKATFSLDLMRAIIKMPARIAPARNSKIYPQFNKKSYKAPHLYAICFKFDGDKFHSSVGLGA